MSSLLLCGSTGSIGTQTLELLRGARGAWRVEGLTAHGSWELLLEQALEFRPRFVAISDPTHADTLRRRLPAATHVFTGPDAAERATRECEYDIALNGIVGAAGLLPSVRVLERGKRLALANKESLVIAGDTLMQLARDTGGVILPVDSEHSAVFQCLRGEDVGRVRRILLTASGGPFRTASADEMTRATPATALKHPNWSMGPRITIGSATLMNKALEVIELHHLFGLSRERIAVVIHPQSIVHSMVEFVDGSVMAQMGPPDMRGPIQYALHHPDRAPCDLRGFDVGSFRSLTFEEPDAARFPALELGFRCVDEGGDSGAVLNAADEVSVQAFLDGAISFPDIPRINRRVLDRRPRNASTVEALLASDRSARELTRREIEASRASASVAPPAAPPPANVGRGPERLV